MTASSCCRPLVGVYGLKKTEKGFEMELSSQLPLPDVFKAPIRKDLVEFVHNQISRNKRQPYAVSRKAGVQCSAASWGTGRAVSRIPRVRGSGTHRASQGAYGNMCRGGHMFNPTRTWRRWHRRVNRLQRRHAIVSAIAASGLPSLVFARGHRISSVPELPLVLDSISINKTKNAISVLKAAGVYEDATRCKESCRLRIGKGKMRNRRYQMRRGPLIIHTQAANSDFVRSFRNIPGVDLLNVDSLNLLKLCPGGHLGRLIVWTSNAFSKLSELYPNQYGVSTLKKGYHLPQPMITLPDISRIINSEEVQSVLRPKLAKQPPVSRKKNPLKHKDVMKKLNPLLSIRKSTQPLTDKKVYLVTPQVIS